MLLRELRLIDPDGEVICSSDGTPVTAIANENGTIFFEPLDSTQIITGVQYIDKHGMSRTVSLEVLRQLKSMTNI